MQFVNIDIRKLWFTVLLRFFKNWKIFNSVHDLWTSYIYD